MPLSLALAVLAAGLAAAVWLGRFWHERSLAALVDGLETCARIKPSEVAESRNLGTLPPAVARYLNHVLSTEERNVRLARYEQVGQLRADTQRKRWMQFTASQVVAPALPAFVWDARLAMGPLLHIRVRDSYVEGRGAGQLTLLSAIPLKKAGGNMEMNSGSLHRFLAEAVWYPTALLPSTNLRWEEIDEWRALATLAHGPLSVSLEFRFNEDDEVASIYTPGRWGSFDGGYKQVAWEGRFRKYAKFDGVLVPTEGEVGWFVNGDWRAVWRGSIVGAALEFE